MAATISINFGNEQDVYDENPDTAVSRSKKSISAKTLQDVLGGGVVSGGYVRKTGDSMTGFLTLTSLPPTNPNHAATKSYVDTHAYTRRYYYRIQTAPVYTNGVLAPGTRAVSGIDLYTNPLYFFDKGDLSREAITRYLDVYRDGILQVFGANNDYTIRDIPTTPIQRGLTAVEFNTPLLEGTNIQVNIGSAGAFPVTFGVNFLSAFMGVSVTAVSGDVTLSAVPIHFSATRSEVSNPTRRDIFISPVTLSAFPLSFRAKGLFKKNLNFNFSQEVEKSSTAPYGGYDINGGTSSNMGYYQLRPNSYNLISCKSDANNSSAPTLHRVVVSQGVLESTDYIPIISINNSSDPNWGERASAYLLSDTRTLTSFDFQVSNNTYDLPPDDIYEISITII
jgi:hypothetical protein